MGLEKAKFNCRKLCFIYKHQAMLTTLMTKDSKNTRTLRRKYPAV